MKTSWEINYIDNYTNYIDEILSNNPDFIVPVARKSCKLFNSIDTLFHEVKNRIFYIDYFKFSQINLKNKKFAIFDDAVNSTSKLFEYRDYFKKQGVLTKDIYTYAFIGHKQLLNNPERKYDKDANIFSYVSPANYKKYLLSQSNHILVKGSYPDLDHLILEFEIENATTSVITELWDYIKTLGYRYHLDTIDGIKRFGVHFNNLCDLDELSDELGLTMESDFVQKFRFTVNNNTNTLTFTPMCFPKLFINSSEICVISDMVNKHFGFHLPCSFRDNHKVDKYCYLSVCLFLNSILAKKFLTCVNRDSPNISKLFRKFRIKKSYIIRYLGEETRKKILKTTENFINNHDLKYNNIIQESKINNKISFSEVPIYRANVSSAIHNLRKEYEDAVKKNNNNPVNVKVTKPIDYFLNYGKGIHPLILTEILDEYCDLGTLVPSTDYNTQYRYWHRTYRTGEDPHDIFAWERSKRIIALAINVINPSGTKRMYLEKVLANFCHDFRPHMETFKNDYLELHCFNPTPSYWGTQNFIVEPVEKIRFPISPNNLIDVKKKKWNTFSTYFNFDGKSNQFSSHSPVDDFPEWFGNHRFFRDYFSFLKEIKDKFNKVDSINSLALCRNKEWYNIHIIYNLLQWTTQKSYIGFLEKYKSKYISKEKLAFAYRMAISTGKKLKCLNELPSVIAECKNIAKTKPDYYGDIWEDIYKSIDKNIFNYYKDPIIKDINNIINAMKALDGITRVKLILISNPENSRTVKNVNMYAQDELDELGIIFNVNEFIHSNHHEEDIYSSLNYIYEKIEEKILRLPLPHNFDKIINQYTTSDLLRMADKLDLLMPKRQSSSLPMIAKCLKVARDELGFNNPEMYDYKKSNNSNAETVIKIRDDFGEDAAFLISSNSFNLIKQIYRK